MMRPMLKRLKKDKRARIIPVIVLTNLTDNNTLNKIQKLGIRDFVVKTDWEIEKLIKTVRNLLG